MKEYTVLVTATYTDIYTERILANTPEEAEVIAYNKVMETGCDIADAEVMGEA